MTNRYSRRICIFRTVLFAVALTTALCPASGWAQIEGPATFTPAISQKLEARSEPAKVATEDVPTLTSKGYVEIGSIRAGQPGKKANAEVRNRMELVILTKAAEAGGDLVYINTDPESIPTGKFRKTCTEHDTAPSTGWTGGTTTYSNSCSTDIHGFQHCFSTPSTSPGHPTGGGYRCTNWEQVEVTSKGWATTARVWRYDPKLIADIASGAAARKAASDKAESLQASGTGINARDKNGYTALIRAIRDAKLDEAEALLDRGADVNVLASEPAHDAGDSPLLEASFFLPGLMKTLVERGAKVDAVDIGKDTPLYNSVCIADPEILKLLVEKGTDVNMQDNISRTPLMHAASCPTPRVEIVKVLLASGADGSLKDYAGKTAADLAREQMGEAKNSEDKEKFQQMIQLLNQGTQSNTIHSESAQNYAVQSNTIKNDAIQKDTVFEMPGVFHIELPQGWQKTKVIDDRLTVAAFSSKDLTLEVMREVSSKPVEQYVQSITDRRFRYEADDYPGKYTPPEVLANIPGYTVEATLDFDEYTSIGGLPALWMRNRLVYTKTPQETHAARVWSVVILSKGEYWSLELRGDDRAWPAADDDLRRMVRSFRLLEPTLGRVKAAIPPEAWKRVPATVSEGSCQFVGIASGIGVVVPCGWEVTDRRQAEGDVADGLIGVEQVALGTSAVLNLYHYKGNWSADEFLQSQEQALVADVKTEKVSGRSMSYKRNNKQDIAIDGATGTRIWGTGKQKKTHNELSLQMLTFSVGTDYFSMQFSSGPDYARDHRDEIEQIFTSVHSFPLRPESASAPEQKKPAWKARAWADFADAFDMFDDLPKGDIGSILSGCDAHPAHPPTSAQLERAREDVRLFNDSNSHLHLGNLLHSSGDCAGGSVEFMSAVQISPRNAEADQEAARVYLPIIQEALEETLAKKGDFPSSEPGKHNDLDRAIAAWERVLAYGQSGYSDNYVHSQLASLYALQRNTLFALFHLGNAGSEARNIDLLTDKTDADKKTLENLTAQAQAAKDALLKDPTAQNRVRYAELEMSYGDFAGASVQCRLAHRIDPRNVSAVQCLTRIAVAIDEQETAIDYAQEWLALSPNAPEAYFRIAGSYLWDPTDFQKAAQNFEASIRNSGKEQMPPAMLQAAQVFWPYSYENAKLWPEAAKAYDDVVRVFPSEAHVLNSAAWFYATTKSPQRNPKKALDYATRAVAAAPTDANIMDTLAEAYFINGRIDSAVATEQKALALAPDNVEIQAQIKRFKQAKQANQNRKPQPPHAK
jgi:tetratricopeptide (TPR) repeat protein